MKNNIRQAIDKYKRSIISTTRTQLSDEQAIEKMINLNIIGYCNNTDNFIHNYCLKRDEIEDYYFDKPTYSTDIFIFGGSRYFDKIDFNKVLEYGAFYISTDDCGLLHIEIKIDDNTIELKRIADCKGGCVYSNDNWEIYTIIPKEYLGLHEDTFESYREKIINKYK